MKKHIWTRRQLLRFSEIADIWVKYNKMGIPNTTIYRDYIEYQYGIGIRTFYRILDLPVKKLIAGLGDSEVIYTDDKFNLINQKNGQKTSC